VLKGGALATAAVAVPAGAAALHRGTRLAVYDSTIPESRAFAHAHGQNRLDLAAEHSARFGSVRAGLLRPGSIEGLTRWSDWVALRSEFESQGWRVAAESCVGRTKDLFRWTMTRR
jgi:hypothetical protein